MSKSGITYNIEEEDDVEKSGVLGQFGVVAKNEEEEEDDGSDLDSNKEEEEDEVIESDIDSDDEEEEQFGELGEGVPPPQGSRGVPPPPVSRFALEIEEDEDEEEEEDEEENYLQKFDESVKTNIISEFHPELIAHNYDEVDILTRVVRNEAGLIIDPLHRTLPFLTKYERARILGERAKQINAGAKPFVEVDASVIDGYLIAMAEFDKKMIPFIIKRPLPNGGCEYWKFRDLEVL